MYGDLYLWKKAQDPEINPLGHDWDNLCWLDGWFCQERNAGRSGVTREVGTLLPYLEAATRKAGWPSATVHELRRRARQAGLAWLGKYGRRDELQAALLLLSMGAS